MNNENYPPLTTLENEISQVQFPYFIKGGEICTGIDIGYRAAAEKYRTQAIGFAEWLQENGWVKYNVIDRWEQKYGRYYKKLPPQTSSELYDLYLKTLEDGK